MLQPDALFNIQVVATPHSGYSVSMERDVLKGDYRSRNPKNLFKFISLYAFIKVTGFIRSYCNKELFL